MSVKDIFAQINTDFEDRKAAEKNLLEMLGPEGPDTRQAVNAQFASVEAARILNAKEQNDSLTNIEKVGMAIQKLMEQGLTLKEIAVAN